MSNSSLLFIINLVKTATPEILEYLAIKTQQQAKDTLNETIKADLMDILVHIKGKQGLVKCEQDVTNIYDSCH